MKKSDRAFLPRHLQLRGGNVVAFNPERESTMKFDTLKNLAKTKAPTIRPPKSI
ncbi:hypothetical protein [Aquabacterium humicola]|uniref:hypothetical protein n=1 Tax=Aquabacterium humicola TaxID=3237377 RepID=UPI002543EFF2|nr:hypothetical protein [Rubrivivax pictus]